MVHINTITNISSLGDSQSEPTVMGDFNLPNLSGLSRTLTCLCFFPLEFVLRWNTVWLMSWRADHPIKIHKLRYVLCLTPNIATHTHSTSTAAICNGIGFPLLFHSVTGSRTLIYRCNMHIVPRYDLLHNDINMPSVYALVFIELRLRVLCRPTSLSYRMCAARPIAGAHVRGIFMPSAALRDSSVA